MTEYAGDAVGPEAIFTTSFSGLRGAVTKQRTWFGYAWYATRPLTGFLGLRVPNQMTWNAKTNTWVANWKGGNYLSSFERTFRLFFLLDGVAQIVYVGDATGTGP